MGESDQNVLSPEGATRSWCHSRMPRETEIKRVAVVLKPSQDSILSRALQFAKLRPRIPPTWGLGNGPDSPAQTVRNRLICPIRVVPFAPEPTTILLH